MSRGPIPSGNGCPGGGAGGGPCRCSIWLRQAICICMPSASDWFEMRGIVSVHAVSVLSCGRVGRMHGSVIVRAGVRAGNTGIWREGHRRR